MLFEIGQEIRTERKSRKISQETMARDLGMSRATISQFESGTIQEIGVVVSQDGDLAVQLVRKHVDQLQAQRISPARFE